MLQSKVALDDASIGVAAAVGKKARLGAKRR